ncbi:MAG: hypothetical protein DMF98_18450 [Acidobacteria bacterium]|nr:MAG: hypothetical protein DMF98_18450 [Acidobacteriota bacterium]
MKPWPRLRYWLRRPRLEADLAEEIRLHREMLEDEFVREGASSPTPDSPRSAASETRPPSSNRAARSGAWYGSTRSCTIFTLPGGWSFGSRCSPRPRF